MEAPKTTAPKTDLNSQSVYVSDKDMVKVYPKTMSAPEIDFDLHTEVRGNKAEDFYLNWKPMQDLKDAFKKVATDAPMSGMASLANLGVPVAKGEEQMVAPAMKLWATRPDVAAGFSSSITPEEIEETYKPWLQVWRDSVVGKAATGYSDKVLARGADAPLMSPKGILTALPWFFSEHLPDQLLSFGTKPSSWGTVYGMEKAAPVVLNETLKSLPSGVRATLLKDMFASEKGLQASFEALDLPPNAKTSDVIKAFRAKATETHPDLNPGREADFMKAQEAYKAIMKTRGGWMDKFSDMFRAKKDAQVGEPIGYLEDASGEAGYVRFPLDKGDLVKVADKVGQILDVSGDMALVNLAGKTMGVPLSELKPHEKTGGSYSPLEDAVENKLPNRGTPEQMLRTIEGQGVSKEEVQDMGLFDFLKDKTQVTKQEIQSYLQGNDIQIKEVVRGGTVKPDILSAKENSDGTGFDIVDSKGKSINFAERLDNGMYSLAEDTNARAYKTKEKALEAAQYFYSNENPETPATKFERYQLPGGSNYREVVMTMPPSTRRSILEKTGKLVAYEDVKKHDFKSPHYPDDRGYLAHFRLNDRIIDNKKYLFAEEIQADGHQKGREVGYGTRKELTPKDQFKIEERDKDVFIVHENGEPIGTFTTRASAQNSIDEMSNIEITKGVPDAPFKKTWHELALKRILKMAVEEGYDGIAWTTGEQQAERYDLSKQVDYIDYSKNEDGTFNLDIQTKGPDSINKENQTEQQLKDLIGKDAAEKIVKGVDSSSGADELSDGLKRLEGEDLKVGGEGMKGFYDQMIPQFLNKYTKKWGGRVSAGSMKTTAPFEESGIHITNPHVDETGRFPVDENYYKNKQDSVDTKVHTLEITPSMKKGISQGQSTYGTQGKMPKEAGSARIAKGDKENWEEPKTEVVYESQGLRTEISKDVKGSAGKDAFGTRVKNLERDQEVQQIVNAIPEQSLKTAADVKSWLEERGLKPKSLDEQLPKDERTAPMEAIDVAVEHPDFKELSIFDKARVLGQLQRVTRNRLYSEEIDIGGGNLKTTGSNIVEADTIRGCTNNCVERYALKGANQGSISFERPVPTTINGELNSTSDVLRLGTVGDPATDWVHSAEQKKAVFERSVAKGVDVNPKDNSFEITKLQSIKGYDHEVFPNLEVSIDTLYPQDMMTAIKNLEQIKDGINVALRIRSLETKNPEVQAVQDLAVAYANARGLQVLETKVRFVNGKIFDALEMNPAKYIKKRQQFQLKNPALRDKAEKWNMCDAKGTGKCKDCRNCERLMTGLRNEKKSEGPNWRFGNEKGGANLLPFKDGDLAKVGKEVVNVVKISGEMATVNSAGKVRDVKVSDLKKVEAGEPAVNLENIKSSDDAKQRLMQASDIARDELSKTQGPLTHDEVIEAAKQAEILKAGVSRQQTLDFQASLLATRQHLAALAEQNELTPQFIDTLKVMANLGTDIARNLESFKIEAMSEYATAKVKIIKNLIKLGTDTDEILKAAKGVDFSDQESVAKFYRKFVAPTIPEMLNEFAYMNILSSPLTHFRNLFGNLIQLAGMNPLTKLFSGAVDSVVAGLSGAERTHYVKEVPAFYKGALNAIPKALEGVAQAMSGKVYMERPDVKHLPTKAKWIDYATLGLGKYVTRALEASDVFFKTMIYEGEVEALSERIGHTPDDKEIIKIEKQAMALAEKYVFRSKPDADNKTGQGNVLSGIDQMTNAVYRLREVPGAKWIIRFVQTPMNIAKQGLEYSPLGFSTLPGSKDKTEQAGKAILGSMVFTGGFFLALSGRTTWKAPTSAQEKALFYAAGMQPYSIKIGDSWVSYSKIGPLAYPLAMASALHYYAKESPDALSDSAMEKAMDVLGGVLGFFGDQSYVQGLGDLAKTLQGDKTSMTRLVTGVPSQLIPLSGLQGWVNSLLDPMYRKFPKGLSLESITQSLQSKIIGLSTSRPVQKDVFGKEQKKDPRFLNSFSPVAVKKENPHGEATYKAVMNTKQISNKYKKQAEQAIG